MQNKGITIYPEELSDYWLDRLGGSGLNILGIHPPGGVKQGKAVEALIEWRRLPETQRLIDRAESMGICVEYEIHAMSWLLPRCLFDEHPAWFRMDENGNRTADYNLCVSEPDALEYVSGRAAELTEILKTSSGRYHFWTDDVPHPKCHCPRCQELTASDEAITVYNAILKGVRRIHPDATLSYLAYDDAISAPEKVKPDEGIFLEYAPMMRNVTRPLTDPESEMNRKAIAPLDRLLEVFGHKNAQALEYWLDNSWFSEWKIPIRRFAFSPDIVALDSAWYEKLGFETISSFAIYLGEDYYNLYGQHFDIMAYVKALG